tara:strand:- start:107 stop:577 length:471 start_codon:yes stop_codon:yes gene_type:complete
MRRRLLFDAEAAATSFASARAAAVALETEEAEEVHLVLPRRLLVILHERAHLHRLELRAGDGAPEHSAGEAHRAAAAAVAAAAATGVVEQLLRESDDAARAEDLPRVRLPSLVQANELNVVVGITVPKGRSPPTSQHDRHDDFFYGPIFNNSLIKK